MDFARKQLEKYGWKDGDGLGRTGSGISKPIKAKLKFDNSGLGHNISDELVNPWWARVYDTAAKNVTVEKDGKVVKLDTLGATVEITTKKIKKRKKTKCERNAYGGNFVMRASLTCDGETFVNSERCDSDDEEPVNKKRTSGICDMTDEELFKSCGKRTVHKGARHGLSMSAKLARLQQQETDKDLNHGHEKKKKRKRDK